ncbi:MAG: hypothetical protein JKX94_11285, partial [Sneathiella sp.]|nr:hypothetical protein [Sneathiella sp.]
MTKNTEEVTVPTFSLASSPRKKASDPSMLPHDDRDKILADAVDDDIWDVRLNDVSRADHDPLLGCLVALTKIFDDPRTADALIYGLPLEENCLTPQLFIRAAQRVNLSARITNRKLRKIPPVVLPTVLLLKERRACILLEINGDKAVVIFPESGEGSQEVNLNDLENLYAGYAIFIRPHFKFRIDRDENLIERKGSWFWGTMLQFWPTYLQVILAAALINSFAIASPLFIMNVYDRVVPNKALETLWVLAFGVIIV